MFIYILIIQIHVVYIEFRWRDITWVIPNVTQPTDNNAQHSRIFD